jgi:SNF2 family DNA or RNA helicase
MTTHFHSKYWAYALTLKSASTSPDSLSRSLANARVDLNPHQIEAALFAMKSPLSKGVILADEVGLGKTIEAGLVIAQRWAERRRKILLVVPAFLRQQWQQELEEKFFIRSVILDGKSFSTLQLQTPDRSPFDRNDAVMICSYNFASAKADELERVRWDLAVLDEAHRLRNVYKSSNKMAKSLKRALVGTFKVLLTATPLQNNLSELYGLVSIIDDQVFGSESSFKDQFGSNDEPLGLEGQLRQRIQQFCHRTLRKQVKEYVSFTERKAETWDFNPNRAEIELYEAVNAFLKRDQSHALPSGQRQLITLVLQKLLASSSVAIAGTLNSMLDRLKRAESMTAPLTDEDLEGIEALAEELEEEPRPTSESTCHEAHDNIKEEILEIERLASMASAIEADAKGEALLKALPKALNQMTQLGALEKAVIFTESRRTQTYLFDLLTKNGYADRLVMINGANSDPTSKTIYREWLESHAGTDRITGVKAVDMKAAIVERFRNTATILIATEAAAEGMNLQFCSLIINYDLPWNPQRVEQRIGRCHRYGQKHDVVVVNFLNQQNQADQRVYELLRDKFNAMCDFFE